MKAISQEDKDEIINQFIECRRGSLMKTPDKNSFERAFALCVGVVESFPVSDGWIPVSERLPEKYELVLIFNERYGTGGYKIASFNNIDYHGNPIFYDRTTMRKATHWQPLPNPPTSHK